MLRCIPKCRPNWVYAQIASKRRGFIPDPLEKDWAKFGYKPNSLLTLKMFSPPPKASAVHHRNRLHVQWFTRYVAATLYMPIGFHCASRTLSARPKFLPVRLGKIRRPLVCVLDNIWGEVYLPLPPPLGLFGRNLGGCRNTYLFGRNLGVYQAGSFEMLRCTPKFRPNWVYAQIAHKRRGYP